MEASSNGVIFSFEHKSITCVKKLYKFSLVKFLAIIVSRILKNSKAGSSFHIW